MILTSGITVGSGVTMTGEYLLVTDGLQLFLDAGNTSSISSGTTTWNDVSGNGRNFTFSSALSYGSNGSASTVIMNSVGTGPTSNSYNITENTYSFFILTGRAYSPIPLYDTSTLYLPGTFSPGLGDTSGTFFDLYDGENNVAQNFENYQCGFDNNDASIYTSSSILGTQDFTKYSMYAFTNNNIVRYMYRTLSSGEPTLIGVNSQSQYTMTLGTYSSYLGYTFGGTVDTWPGKINCILLYNRALSYDEVRTNFLFFKSRGLYGTSA